jgi:hypothetical protein
MKSNTISKYTYSRALFEKDYNINYEKYLYYLNLWGPDDTLVQSYKFEIDKGKLNEIRRMYRLWK